MTGHVVDEDRYHAIDTALGELDLGGRSYSNCVTVMAFDEPTDRELLR